MALINEKLYELSRLIDFEADWYILNEKLQEIETIVEDVQKTHPSVFE